MWRIKNFLFAVAFDCNASNCLFFFSKFYLSVRALTQNCTCHHVFIFNVLDCHVFWEEIIHCFENWLLLRRLIIVSPFWSLKLGSYHTPWVLGLCSLFLIIVFFFSWCIVWNFDIIRNFNNNIRFLFILSNLFMNVGPICLYCCRFWSRMLLINRVI